MENKLNRKSACYFTNYNPQKKQKTFSVETYKSVSIVSHPKPHISPNWYNTAPYRKHLLKNLC